jgi:hypothetical protein
MMELGWRWGSGKVGGAFAWTTAMFRSFCAIDISLYIAMGAKRLIT